MDAYDKGSDARQELGRDGREGSPGPDGAPEQTGGSAGTGEASGASAAEKASGGSGTAGASGASGTADAWQVSRASGTAPAPEREAPADAGSEAGSDAGSDPGAAGPEAGSGPDAGGDARSGAGSGADSEAGAVFRRGSGTEDGGTLAPAVPPASPAGPRTGVAALSPRYQVGAVVALAAVAVAVCAHIGLVFLHVAPSNTLTKQHGSAVDDWVFPEFEQNWKLFAPNPLQQNVSVQVRAEVATADGAIRTTGWYDLSAEDGRAIDGNPLPSHTQQNELRRAWDFFVSSHDSEDRPVGLRGSLSETYLRRIALLRLDRNEAAGPGGVVERVQYRSRTTNVEPPPWSGEKVSDRPTYRELPWWSVSPEQDDEGREDAGRKGADREPVREGGAA